MRIVSLLPSATEILFGIGAGDDVVGVTHECDFPVEALSRAVLTSSALPEAPSPAQIDRHVRRSLHAGSSLYHLDAELLERLAPDLIVTQELCEVCAVSYRIVDRAARRLRGDARIVSLEPSSLEDVLANIAFIGDLTGYGEGALRLLRDLRAQIESLRRRSRRASGPPPRVLVLEWTDPPMSAGHWTPGLVELAGAQAVLSDPGADSQRLEWQNVAAADPDAVVVAPCGYDLPKTRAAIAELASLSHWTELRAVREGRVLAMDGSAYVNRPGPRLVESAYIMAQWLGRL